MLLELLVENYAVVERVRVRFHPGFNLLTGETGSGKSIVVDALGLLFGGRASGDMVRSESTRSRISGIFEAPQDPAFRVLLEAAGVEIEDGELLVEREVLASGKSRAFAGSRPVTAALLREMAAFLGDIHGQHEQQRLFTPEVQMEMLDAFAGSGALVSKVGDLFARWSRCGRELEELDRFEQEKLRLADLWSFQRKEIEAAAVKAREDSDLEQERLVLRNVARLQESAGAAYAALYEDAESASKQLRIASRKLDDLCRIDASLAGALEAVKAADLGVEEASSAVRDYLAKLEADPARLEDVEARLAALERLKRKYGASLDEVLAFLENVRRQMDAVEDAGERKARLEKELAQLAEEYRAAAAELTELRKRAAVKLAAKLEEELGSLALENTVFQMNLQPASWSARGTDRVEFLISPNVGEEPRPLDRVASGGELSRIALALKTVVGSVAGGVSRTLVFDEVDSGIGGGVAEAVGRRLKRLAGSNQVLCVTHLAQVAGFADHHYSVEKREVAGRTVAEVEELTGEARTREIGRMLSGQRVTQEALRQAEQLLKIGSRG
jgi:DNA repair protein RecN (Recombination protein N)